MLNDASLRGEEARRSATNVVPDYRDALREHRRNAARSRALPVLAIPPDPILMEFTTSVLAPAQRQEQDDGKTMEVQGLRGKRFQGLRDAYWRTRKFMSDWVDLWTLIRCKARHGTAIASVHD